MNRLIKNLFFLICLLSSFGVTATEQKGLTNKETLSKLYIDLPYLEFTDSGIFIHIDNLSLQTNALRSDQRGLYVFEEDLIKDSEFSIADDKWQCPYCNHWWPLGKKCTNDGCPTNLWSKE